MHSVVDVCRRNRRVIRQTGFLREYNKSVTQIRAHIDPRVPTSAIAGLAEDAVCLFGATVANPECADLNLPAWTDLLLAVRKCIIWFEYLAALERRYENGS